MIPRRDEPRGPRALERVNVLFMATAPDVLLLLLLQMSFATFSTSILTLTHPHKLDTRYLCCWKRLPKVNEFNVHLHTFYLSTFIVCFTETFIFKLLINKNFEFIASLKNFKNLAINQLIILPNKFVSVLLIVANYRRQ